MSIQSFFFNAVKTGDTYDRTYSAEDFSNYLRKMVSDGVFVNPSTNLQVLANSTMGAVVKAGEGWIAGHKLVLDADLVLTFDASDVALGRIDRIVFVCDYANRVMNIEIKKGMNAVTPVAPTLQRDNKRYELSLATVSIPKQTTSISQPAITDDRGDDSLCGWVACLIDHLDTKTLFAQWQTAYTESITKDQATFDTWFKDVKDNLASATLIRQYTSSYETTQMNESVIPINIPQFNLNLDILNVFISGMKLIQDVDYTKDSSNITLKVPLHVVGTSIEFEVFKSVDGSKAETVVQQVEDLQKETLELEKKKADKKWYKAVLMVADWKLNTTTQYYQCTAPVQGVGADDILIISPDPQSVEDYAGVYAYTQTDKEIGFKAKTKPTETLYINILDLGLVALS